MAHELGIEIIAEGVETERPGMIEIELTETVLRTSRSSTTSGSSVCASLACAGCNHRAVLCSGGPYKPQRSSHWANPARAQQFGRTVGVDRP